MGVSKANNLDELNVSILQIFALGDDVLVEPFVENLEEYNISLTKALTGEIKYSVIEHPLKKDGSKLMSSEKKMGMISQTRDFVIKELTNKQKENIRKWAVDAFEALNCNGVVRIDFMYNSKTKDFYFTEANTIPGSFSYFLWEASDPAYTFTELVDGLVNEALNLNKNKKGNIILANSKSKIFKEKK